MAIGSTAGAAQASSASAFQVTRLSGSWKTVPPFGCTARLVCVVDECGMMTL
jgi:hypothetical protein